MAKTEPAISLEAPSIPQDHPPDLIQVRRFSIESHSAARGAGPSRRTIRDDNLNASRVSLLVEYSDEESFLMPRITKVYTRTGDDGTTALGGGQRLAKDALRIQVIGTVDELNSNIGVVRSLSPCDEVAAALAKIQNDLFHLGSDLCILESDKEHKRVPVIEERHVNFLEELIDQHAETLPPLENFVLPGGSSASAQLHLARTVCRRAERLLVSLDQVEKVGPVALRYVNRLSDALFVLARAENQARGFDDVLWDSRA